VVGEEDHQVVPVVGEGHQVEEKEAEMLLQLNCVNSKSVDNHQKIWKTCYVFSELKQ
jgi:hypothetical protein